MNIINRTDKYLSLKSYRNLFILIIITALGLIGRVYDLHFSYGVSFALGSLFVFVILRYYGLIVASSAVMIINILDWCLFNGSIYTVFFFFEVLIVGVLWQKRHRNLFLVDVFYWVIIGAPASVLLFYLKRNCIGVECWLLVSNISINELMNVLIADIILSYIPIQRIFGQKGRNLVDLNKMIFHLTIAAVLGPFLVYTLVDAWVTRDSLDSEIYQTLNATNLNIMEKAKTWSIDDLRKLRLKSPVYTKKFKTILNNNPLNKSVEVLLVDRNYNIYLTNNEKTEYEKIYNWKEGGNYTLVNNNVYVWFPSYRGPTFDLSRWSQAFYIMVLPFRDIDMQLQIKLPLSNFSDIMWKNYLNKFFILLFFCFASVFISIMTSRFMSRDLSKLTRSTTGLPEKLKRQEVIEWPDTSIAQINSLASNFQVMSNNLVNLFNEAKIMNNQLLFQTKELEISKDKLRQLAYNDALTGLPNRLYFTDYLEEQLNSAHGRNIAVLFMDLNRFKQINDTLGHEIGDMLIKEVANRLRNFLKDDSFVARMGGDEFVIVLSNADKKKATNTAIHINKTLTETVYICQKDQIHEFYVTSSIGISMYPNDALEKSTLLKNADLAMYAAKETGDNTFRFYSELAESNMSDQLILEQSLCKALDRHEIIINYQPKISVQEKTITGMEALIRWNHPQKGLIPPAQFIPLAEETGIINQIGEWVLVESCKQNKELQNMGYPKMRISVNLSLKQFHGNNIVRMVTKALRISGLEPEYLELEITEGFLIKNTEFIISVLKELRDIGVYISIDDFGTGYSSLGRLKELPIQFLKIDKSFIKDISCEKTNSSIVAAIIQLAHSMGLKVVAEGVETIEEFDSLNFMDCDEVQGYLFSKPVSINEFEKMISNFSYSTYVSK